LGGMPPFLTLLAAANFYLYAAARRVPFALDCFTAAVALFSVIDPDTLTVADLNPLHPAPLAAAALLQVWLGFQRRDLWRFVVGGAVPVAWACMMGWRGYRALRENVAGLDY